MDRQQQVFESIKSLGVEPIEGNGIIVQFMDPSVSPNVTSFLFLSASFYILQICKNELILVQPNSNGMAIATKLKKNTEVLRIDFSTIKKISVEDHGINYQITISSDDGDINLTVQRKELSVLRSSGAITAESMWPTDNWHAKNIDATLKKLEELSPTNQ